MTNNRVIAFPPFPSSHPSCPALSHRSQDLAETHSCGFFVEILPQFLSPSPTGLRFLSQPSKLGWVLEVEEVLNDA